MEQLNNPTYSRDILEQLGRLFPIEDHESLAFFRLPFELAKVRRWVNQGSNPEYNDDRRQEQNVAQHTLSILYLTNLAKHRLNTSLIQAGYEIDWSFVYEICLWHDSGEIFRIFDCLDADKSISNDVREYRVIQEYLSSCCPSLQRVIRRIYLAQHGLKLDLPIESEANALIDSLRKRKNTMMAIAIHKAIEELEYVLYALEQFCKPEYANVDLLLKIIHDELVTLDECAEFIPGYAQAFWKPELRAWCVGLYHGCGRTDFPKQPKFYLSQLVN